MGVIHRPTLPTSLIVLLLAILTASSFIFSPTNAQAEGDSDEAVPISSTSVQVGETVTLYNNYDWDYDIDFGDGTTGALLPTDPNGTTVSSLEHTYSSPGTYEIKGTRVDGTLMWFTLHTVTVSAGEETTTTEEPATTTEETTTTTEETTTTPEETTTTIEETTTTMGESTTTTINRVQPSSRRKLAAQAVEVAEKTASAGGFGAAGLTIALPDIRGKVMSDPSFPLKAYLGMFGGAIIVPATYFFGMVVFGGVLTVAAPVLVGASLLGVGVGLAVAVASSVLR